MTRLIMMDSTYKPHDEDLLYQLEEHERALVIRHSGSLSLQFWLLQTAENSTVICVPDENRSCHILIFVH